MRQPRTRTQVYAAVNALLLLTLAARPATAIQVATLALSGETGAETADIDSATGAPPIAASATHSSPNGQADASATLDEITNSLGVSVQANAPASITQLAVAAFTESFTFTEADDVTFTFDIDGTVTGSNTDVLSLVLGASVDIDATDDLSTLPIFLDSAPVVSGITTLTVGPVAFEANVAREVSFILAATGLLPLGGDYDANFLNTATLTSVSNPNLASTGSGNTYGAVVAAPELSGTPEPTAFVLAILGLLMLAMTGRRRRTR